MGTIETIYSDHNVAVVNAQNRRWGQGPMDTSANHAVLHAQNDRWGLAPIESCNSGAKVAV